MSHMLDRPIWTALNTRQAMLAEGGELARRYPSSVAPFAATGRDDGDSLRAFENLVPPGESVILLQADEIRLPAGFLTLSTATGVQMLAAEPLQTLSDERIIRLTEHDAAAMLDLAALTRPGPFTQKAQSLGAFWGVKINGRLAAMAGERMKQPGFTELSGVCTAPDQRGAGLGKLLSLYVANRIMERGEIPYLHAYVTNDAAIALYESIGFKVRCRVNVAVVQRDERPEPEA